METEIKKQVSKIKLENENQIYPIDNHINMVYNWKCSNVKISIGGLKMKVERFIKEYAKFQIDCIKGNEFIKEEVKEKALTKIDRILKYKEDGLVTVDETIRTILNVFE